MNFRYPANDYQRLETLKSNLGTSWAYIQDGTLFDDLMLARGQLELQSCKDIDALLHCSSIETTPIHRVVLWYPLVLSSYNRDLSLFLIPGGLISAPIITSGISSTATVLVSGIDFYIAAGMLKFTEDPFNNPAFHQEPFIDALGYSQPTITVWLANARFDENYLCRFWGAQENLFGTSSPEYRELINCVSRAIMSGTAVKDIEEIVALLNSAPLCKDDGEIVEVCNKDNSGPFVATNKHVYRGLPGAIPVVKVDDVLSAGTPIFNTISFTQDTVSRSLVCNITNGKTPESLKTIDQDKLLRHLTAPHEAVVIKRN